MKVLIAVTHLLGAGHLSRALTLGRAFAHEGHEVVLLSGGQPAPHMDQTGVRLVQLPPVASDGTNFTRLLDGAGHDVNPAYFASRTQVSVDTLYAVQPDILLTELFPFGRRSLSTEFLTLLEATRGMRQRPKILCSIRDILAPPSKPSKADKARDILLRYYDGVLVHSDPHITTLSDSWPVAPELEPLLKYTGYVAPPHADPHPEAAGRGEVLVSAGGGSVGQSLFECAVDAARQSDRHWRLLVGGTDRVARIAELTQRAGDLDISIEEVRPDFRQMLHGAAASVSMCGYNTALDLLQTGVPAVLVPFDDGGEVEQTLRSRSLAGQSAISVLMSQDMTPALMAQNVAQVIAEGQRHDGALQLDGAAETVRICVEMIGENL